MRIDGNYNVDATFTGRAAPQAQLRPQAPAEGQAIQVQSDPELTTRAASYASQANACQDMDMDAIAQAKALLAGGKLDTPEAILRAAQAMLDTGF